MEKEKCNRNQSKSSVFIVTRPIQYINVLNIPRVNDSNRVRVLILVNSFNGYEDIIKHSQDAFWFKIIVASSVYKAIDWVIKSQSSIDSLYLFSDYGIRIHLKLNRLHNVSIFLYEEGVATYNRSFSSGFGIRSLLFKICDRSLFSGCYIGNYPNLKGIYVYNVKLFRQLKPFCSHPVYTFEKNFFENIRTNERIAFLVYKENIDYLTGKNVLLYLSDWNYDSKIIDICLQYHDYIKILKPHPHLNSDDKFDNLFDIKIDSKFIAETLIVTILQKAKSLIVVHNNSSVILHFLTNPIFHDINLHKTFWFQEICDVAKSM